MPRISVQFEADDLTAVKALAKVMAVSESKFVAMIFLERMRASLAAQKSDGLSLENPDKSDLHNSIVR
jgi:hypothetical protein